MTQSYRINANVSAFQAGGALREGALYIERDGDIEIMEALSKQSCYVIGPPGVGKSSLRLRTQRRIRDLPERPEKPARLRAIDIDLGSVGALTEGDWFFTIAFEIASKLGLESALDTLWEEQEDAPPAERWRQFVLERAISEEGLTLVLFFDDVQAVLDLSFRGSFLRAVRSLAEEKPAEVRFCFFGLVPLDALVDDRGRTALPEATTAQLVLSDFTVAEAGAFEAPLAATFDAERASELLGEILEWTSGHPSMTQRLCHDLEADQHSKYSSDKERVLAAVSAAFLNRAISEDASLLFAERYLSSERPGALLQEVLSLYEQVQMGERVPSRRANPAERQLRLCGIVALGGLEASAGGPFLKVRNRIFARFFDREWLEEKKHRMLLSTQMQKWDAGGRPKRLLLTARALQQVNSWSRTRRDLEPPEREFLHLSLDAALVSEKARNWRRASSVLAVAVAFVSGLGAYAWSERTSATANLRAAKAAELMTLQAREAASTLKKVGDFDFDRRRGTSSEQIVREAVLQGLRVMQAVERGPSDVQAPPLRFIAAAQSEFWHDHVLRDAAAPAAGMVLGVSLSPDGARALVAGPGSSASLWNVTTKARSATMASRRGGMVREAAFSRRGDLVVTVSQDGTSSLWDGATGRLVKHLDEEGPPVTTTAFSPTEDLVVTAGDDGVARLWEAASGKLVFATTTSGAPINRVRFSGDGRLFAAAGSGGTSQVWDVAGRLVATLSAPRGSAPKGHSAPVDDVALSPDGKLAITGAEDGVARLWDVRSGAQIAAWRGHGSRVFAVAFSPDGKLVATAGESNVVQVWSVTDASFVSSLEMDSGGVNRVLFSPDGKVLGAACADQHLRRWNIETARLMTDLVGHEGAVTDIAFSSDGSRMLSGSADGTARIWEPGASGGPPAQLRPVASSGQAGARSVLHIAYSADGGRIAVASEGGALRVWDSAGNSSVALTGYRGVIYKSVFFDNGMLLATAGQDGTARIWDVAAGKELRLVRHAGAVLDVAVSADGGKLVTAGADGVVRAWNARTGDPLWNIEMGAPVEAVAVSRRDRVAVGTKEGALRLVTLSGGKDVMSPEDRRSESPGHTSGIRQLAFSPDDARLVSASNDRTARVWDAESGKALFTLEGHTHYVGGASFSSDGSKIVTFGWDGEVRVWDSAYGRLMLVLADTGVPVRTASFAPDDRWIAAGSLDGTTRLWDAISGDKIATFWSPAGDAFALSFSPDGRRVAVGGQDGLVRLYAASKEGIVAAGCRLLEGTEEYAQVREICARPRLE